MFENIFDNLFKKSKKKRKYTKRTFKEKDMIKDFDPIFLFGKTYKK